MIATPSQTQQAKQHQKNRTENQKRTDQWQKFKSYLDSIASERRETAKAFIEYLAAHQLSWHTIINYLIALRSLEIVGKPYTEMQKQDLMRWSNQLATLHKPSTSNLYRACIKKFFKWLLIDDEESEVYPEVVKWIKTARAKNDYGKTVLSRDQILKMISACETQRDRAILYTLYESGARISELLSMKIKDVSPDQYGAVIRVRGKTGERRIRLIESVPDLTLWLNLHPGSQDKNSSLWITNHNSSQAMEPRNLNSIIEKYAGRADLGKGISAHSFRHARATELAVVLKEPQMREYFGWTKGSDMPSTYVHLSGRDIDKTLLEHYGIAEIEKKEAFSSNIPKQCPRCNHKNSPLARFCQQCSLVLDVKTAMELERATTQADQITSQVLEYITRKMPALVAEAITATNATKALNYHNFDEHNCAIGMGSRN